VAKKRARKEDPKERARKAALIACGPDDPQPPGLEAEVAVLAKTAIRYTHAETELHTRMIEELRVNGASCRQIHRILHADARRPELKKITKKRVQVLWDRITQFWAEASKETATERREAARQRIYQMRAWAAGERDGSGHWVRRPDLAELAKCESLLMKIEGYAVPVEITVDGSFTAALLQVTATLTGEMGSELLEEARENARLAGLAREVLPALAVKAE
jgi:hypothetical protein